MHRAVFLFLRILPVILLMGTLLPLSALAEGIDFNSQLTYSMSDSKITNKTTGETSDSESYRFDQRYNLNLAKTVYPYLTFNAGAFFELDTTKSLTDDVKTEEMTLQPRVGVTLNNPLCQAGLDYRGTRRRVEATDLPKIELFRDDLTANLVWSPADLPLLDLRYNLTHTYDDPETVDVVDKVFTLKSAYTAWEELRLDYTYTRLDTDNRARDFKTLNQTHFGSANYTHNFFEDRLFMNTSYRIRYNTLEFPGAETVQSPLQRFQGLSSVNNDPPDDGPALVINNALIDGNLIASAGINIGLAGSQTAFTNIGLNFGSATDVDEIHVWVDRRLTAAVAGSFSWAVYASPDNIDTSTWSLVATVSPAFFGNLDNRFEISFPKVNTQYIKVVTRALTPAIDPGGQFRDIFVTEMQAFITLSGVEVQNKFTTLDQNYDLNLTGRLSDKTTVGYNLQYLSQDQDAPAEDSSQLFNNIFLNHTFSNIFTASGTLSRTDTTEGDSDTTTHTYGVSMRGTYLPTLSQTLTFSGTNESDQTGSTYDYSVFLRHNATLYSGWSAFLDVGRSWNQLVDNTRNVNNTIRMGTNFIPNSMITLNFNYVYTLTDSEDFEGNTQKTTNKNMALEVFFTPFRALSLSAGINYVERGDFSSTLQQYFVNWSPFPDGDFQFFLNYSESLEPEVDQNERTIGPGFNWKISNHFSLRMSYSYVQSETNTQKADVNNFLSELRINF
ncbi:MAG: hypothetical protein JSU72_06925 [Deltaproteobacteria bacterium]|nr:MAG: hypothetical protein JSU72_06925 [Deltaproteobacteria bacterium]